MLLSIRRFEWFHSLADPDAFVRRVMYPEPPTAGSTLRVFASRSSYAEAMTDDVPNVNRT